MARLRALPDNTFQVCVTSPPYFGLRDYGVPGQIGLEQSPDDYVSKLVEVFREVRRVLRLDGCFFLNIGDSYNNNRSQMGPGQAVHGRDKLNGKPDVLSRKRGWAGLKEKDLIGIPWMLAFALRADGWYLRSEIVWAKPNPMPESIRDRPTASHEKIFLLTKSPSYFWDIEAAKEQSISTHASKNRARRPLAGGTRPGKTTLGDLSGSIPWNDVGGMRNMRNVWTITVKSFREAHFATFPIEIPERAIKAATSEYGACRYCGAPFARIVEKGEPDLEHQRRCGGDATGAYDGQSLKDYATAGAQDASETKRRILAGMVAKKTIGWRQTCSCVSMPPWPCFVLDPFAGAGTTALAAQQLGRNSVGIELNPDYVALAEKRCSQESSGG